MTDWWRDVMGFEEYARVSGDDWFGIVLLHAPTSTLVEFQQHQRNAAEPFDPVRTGFDHTPTVDAEYGSVLTFRDPGRRQYEMFYRINHP